LTSAHRRRLVLSASHLTPGALERAVLNYVLGRPRVWRAELERAVLCPVIDLNEAVESLAGHGVLDLDGENVSASRCTRYLYERGVISLHTTGPLVSTSIGLAGRQVTPLVSLQAPRADSEEHRGFRDLHDDFAAQRLTIIGVSSQPAEELQEAITANGLPQQLAADPTLRFAELLNLPTFRVCGERFYHQLTIVVTRGKSIQVYYPVTIPGRHAAEVLARLHMAL
jgi:hypothetical protein